MAAASRAAWTRYCLAQGLATCLQEPGAPPKYRSQPVTIDGHRFDSRREGRRYLELRNLERAGLISGLELQPRFAIQVAAVTDPDLLVQVGVYTADFRYTDQTGQVIIEDVKSPPTRTTAYRLRKRLVEAIHGVKVTEV